MKYRVLTVVLTMVLAFSMLAATSYAEEIDGVDGEVVIADNDDVLVKITGFNPDATMGYEMTAYIENKTDIDLHFTVDETALNGYLNSAPWGTEVLAGSKANVSIIWYGIEDKGITGDVTRIDFKLMAIDLENTADGPVYEQAFTIYPSGKENAVVTSRELQDSDIVLFDNDFAKAVITGFETDDWGYSANIYLENKTDKKISISTENATVNDYTLNPYWGLQLPAGMKAYSSITWTNSSLADNGISEVDKILLELIVLDTEDWSQLLNEKFTVTP